MLRILQVIDSMNVGGAERMCLNISYTFNENNVENAIVCTRKKGPLGEMSNSPLYVLKKKNSFDVVAFIRLLKLIKSYRPTHLHLHSTSLYWGVLANIFSPKVKLIWHDHYGDSEMLSCRPYLLEKLLVKWVMQTIVVNEKLLNWGLVTLNISSDKIHYLKNFPHILVGENNKSYIKPEKLEIIQVANYRAQKNHDLAIDVAGLMVNKKIDFNWNLFGVVSDLSYYETLVEKASNIGVSNHCNFNIASLSIENELIKNTIGVLTSNSEGLPVALLEYGLAGLIVVCTDVGQCADVLGYGKYGYIVKSNDSIGFANVLDYITKNWGEAKSKAKLFKEHIESNYGSSTFVKKYFEVIDK